MTTRLSEHDQRVAEAGDILPYERALIGGILLDGGAGWFPPLAVEEFLVEGHRAIWEVLAHMARHREPISVLTVVDALRNRGELERAGGPQALAHGILEGCVEVHRKRYASIIRTAARRRMLRQFGLELARQGIPESEIQGRLAAMPGPLTPAIFDAVEVMDDVMNQWGQLRIETGLTPLDTLTGGMIRGQVIVAPAITSHGKTAFACEVTRRVARAGVKVDYFTLEETREGIVRRLAGALTGIPMHAILTGTVTKAEATRLQTAALTLAELPLTVTAPGDAMRSLHAEDVVGAISRTPADLVIVDHIQKILTKGDSRAYGLEAVINELHLVALRDKKVILVTAQVGREANSQRRVPRESDLRDSGALEMFGRQIWVLYWPHKHDQKRANTDYEVYVLKNSEGPTGRIALTFHAQSGVFDDALPF